MMKHRSGAGVAAAAICLFPLLLGCATKRPLPPEAAPKARIASLRVVALDQHRLRLPFALELENPGNRTFVLESFDCSVEVEGVEAGRIEGREAASIGAGGSAALPLEFLVDARRLGDAVSGTGGPATAAFRIDARAILRDADGSALSATASAEGSFPLIREPRLRILALKIARDILVTTQLKLEIEVDNPNAFPIELGSLAYDFYGEGEPWSGGKADRPLLVPAESSRQLPLAFELNFADRDRALLDLVANLQVLRYRLKGSGEVSTGLDYLPDFRLEFDEEGSCQVER
jgi:LEA14-like dessication related protein